MTNGNKVTLPREVAEAIVGLRRLGNSTERIVKAASGELNGERSRILFHFAKETEENYDLILIALVNGFVVEKLPEEIIRDDYEQYDPGSLEYRLGFRWGVEKTLNTLGIKIEGVNVDE
jgi:hypothetical protein